MPKAKRSFDLKLKLARFGSQFQNLNTRDPASWPLVPRLSLCLAVTVGIVAALWLVMIDAYSDELDAEVAKETSLKADYSKKLAQAINLEALRKQREQVQQYVTQLEKQLPGKAEMDALLSDINQAGLGRSLYFELFRPGQVSVREYYAELPIALRVTGRYHDIGDFTSDIAHLSRIVTLNNLVIVPGRDGTLSMEATAKTFRYLDPDEINAQRKATGGAK
ncbi:type 4a pilus biogenesis protein PilO [Ramlibacter rhizophilus]|uniref:Pilus assembly protein PilO n=1 Tax=Ramlibacter rhizophilus TaxID=1781167 RepID=A0A4Z0BMH4_9BURK|nr:type 4a pilus biogenesis protein PilO [Ramlibacter rhizophilus]TFY99603.1 pilus assembly protein PilO [Ramlibacter rhizophilus]